MTALTGEIEVAQPPIAVYRLYGADGALLRVGITENPTRRFREYAKESDWWPRVTRKTVELHSDRESALWAETAVIRSLRPPHNAVASRAVEGRQKPAYPLHHEPLAVTQARESAGLTKTQLAKHVGCSLSLISEIESGSRNATPAMLLRLAEALNCPVVVLERKRAVSGSAA